MDKTADPRRDFRRYAAGRWQDALQIPADSVRVGAFELLNEGGRRPRARRHPAGGRDGHRARILEMETRIARKKPPPVEHRDPTKRFVRMPFAQVRSLLSSVDVDAYLPALGLPAPDEAIVRHQRGLQAGRVRGRPRPPRTSCRARSARSTSTSTRSRSGCRPR